MLVDIIRKALHFIGFLINAAIFLDEREAALIARDALASMIDGKVVHLADVATDKYGRLLANVIIPTSGRRLSEWLIEQRHAVAYDGGTKQRPSSWLEYLRHDELQ